MEPFKFETKYVSEEQATVRYGKYADGTLAIQVLDEYGQTLTVATVCLVDYGHRPGDGNVFIYGDYSEHVGVYEALKNAGIVGEIVRTVPYGPYDAHAFEAPLTKEPQL